MNPRQLSRRDFTQMVALSIGAQLLPTAASSTANTPTLNPSAQDKQVGYAIIGLGRISGHFMAGIQATSNSKVTALVSGHPDKAAAIAQKYNVPKASIYNYENLEAMRDNKQIDAVYIGLPNSMHAEYTIRSAKAGKHVLCEKPMAVSVPEAESMIQACKDANVKLMIAYRLHYEPTNLRAVKLIHDGAIGKVQSIQSTYGFSCGPEEWRLKKSLAGGGPLMDVGIYCLNATRYLTGEEPSSFTAYTYSDPKDARFKEVEESLNWVMRFPSGVLASCNTTYSAPMEGYYRVYGSHGWLQVTPAFNYEGMHLRADLRHEDGSHTQLDEPNSEKDPIHFTREADHFSTCILTNQTPATPGEEGLRDMQYMRATYRSAGIHMA